ncbi:MAG: hypothetical protein H0X12_16835 [Nocardioides sp.]|nr:hypothetical protein [Nocardioides sp.]
MPKTHTIAAAALLMGLVSGCGGSSASSDVEPTAGASSTGSATDAGYAMPEGWPIESFPLPPGGIAGATENATATLVYFPVDGVETEASMAFYADTLPDMGFVDTDNANLLIKRYEGNGLEILVQDDDRGVALITITRT